jgi:hypothetical protein
MKGRTLWMLIGILLASHIVACAGMGNVDREHVAPGDPIVGLLSKGITQLNGNISALSRRIHDVQQASAGTDPLLQELQALDLSGWQLHQQQWMLQRDHLVFARDILEQASKNPGEKGQLLTKWRGQRQEYLKAVEELRQQRQHLEVTHLEVEARLIERGLQ